MPIHHVAHAMKNARKAQRKAIHMLQRSSDTQLKKSNKHQVLPANEWKLLDLGAWWIYRLVGHVWVHGSKLSSLSPHWLSWIDTSLLCAWFWNEDWVLCNAYGTSAITLKWDMGILYTKVTHGVRDPKELRAATSCGHILYLNSGLSNTRLFALKPRNQRTCWCFRPTTYQGEYQR
jgi:hypothetical protein